LAFDNKENMTTEERKEALWSREGKPHRYRFPTILQFSCIHTTFPGILELTHNHGTEDLAETPYVSGNSDPGRGFGHIAITVDDIEAACARFEKLGVPFKKRLTGMLTILRGPVNLTHRRRRQDEEYCLYP
jgi:catechol 2,3-dioxygenase-like lactoylglutathione lyase family enzyme